MTRKEDYVPGRDIAAALNGAKVGRPEPFGWNGAHAGAHSRVDEEERVTWEEPDEREDDERKGDAREDGGKRDDKRDDKRDNEDSEDSGPRYRLLTDTECEDMLPPQPILGDILYEYSVAFLYGPSGRWKTFLTLDFAMSIAAGANWLGHAKVKQGIVVYISAEGGRAIGARIRAWKRHRSITGSVAAIRVITRAVPLLDEDEVTALLFDIREQLDGEQPTLIVVDTLARSMVGGDESSATDAGVLTEAASRIRERFGCCVLFIHHTGYDTTHMRGSTSLYGGADTVMTVSAPEGEALIPGATAFLISKKAKEVERFKPIAFTTARVEWWDGRLGDGGETVGSLVITPATAQSRARRQHADSPPKDEYGDKAILAWKALNKLCLVERKGVETSVWETAALKSGAMSRSTFYSARSDLLAGGWVRQTGILYRGAVPGEPDVSGVTSDGLYAD